MQRRPPEKPLPPGFDLARVGFFMLAFAFVGLIFSAMFLRQCYIELVSAPPSPPEDYPWPPAPPRPPGEGTDFA
jgi:hypothetical protein